MKKIYLESPYGVYYPCKNSSQTAMIYMLGPSRDGFLIKKGVRWLHKQGVNVLSLSFRKENLGYHSYKMEEIGRAISYLKSKNQNKIGIVGGSITATIVLACACKYPELSLVFALSPCDFYCQGYIRKKGEEIPVKESLLTWNDQPMPYLPYAYQNHDYWLALKKESKETKNIIASKNMFTQSERLHPAVKIPVENIQGTVVFCAAQDDCLWDAVKYIHRMEKRLVRKNYVSILYETGTHFLFPQSMLGPLVDLAVFVFDNGRKHPFICHKNRVDLDKKLHSIFKKWKEQS